MSAATDGQLIPKVIHRLWLGPDPVPDEFERYGETWARHHPAWEVRLWRDGDLPPLACRAELERAKNFKARYDMVRYELLRQVGGVIVDLDMEALRPLDPLLGGVRAFVCRETAKERRIGTQVIGAVPHHPLLERAVAEVGPSLARERTASQQTGPGFLTRIVDEFRDEITIFPRDTFLSPLTIEPPRRPQDFPAIYAVHHHAESWRGTSPEARVERLEVRLTWAQAEIHALMRALERRDGDGEERTLERARRELERTRRELAAVTGSRWWRLGRRLRIAKR
ncbi:MAG TPA: glycosyltransferase [Solirubrobacteraceae bacterium]|nr:glycosyltransferase [Solirubrobacteraceae bacterium]